MAPSRKSTRDSSTSSSPSTSKSNKSTSQIKNKSTRSKTRVSHNTSGSRSKKKIMAYFCGKEVQYSLNMLRSIKKLQQWTSELMPRFPFSRVVREITQEFGEFHWNARAIQGLQIATEMYLTNLFEDMNHCAMHAKRTTVMTPDMDLVRYLRQRYEPNLAKN